MAKTAAGAWFTPPPTARAPASSSFLLRRLAHSPLLSKTAKTPPSFSPKFYFPTPLCFLHPTLPPPRVCVGLCAAHVRAVSYVAFVICSFTACFFTLSAVQFFLLFLRCEKTKKTKKTKNFFSPPSSLSHSAPPTQPSSPPRAPRQ
jgi:hypothetical protein